MPGPHFADLQRQQCPVTGCERRRLRGPERCCGDFFQSHPTQTALSFDSRGEMASTRIKLDPQAIEAIARRVVELLERRGLQSRELVDAAELARRLGIERSWVYSHAIELGAVKLGGGAKPRLRFDPEVAARVLRRVGDGPAADPPARSGKRAGQPQGSEGRVELLPIRGSDDSGSVA
jgi:hypothetical protein